MSKQSSVLSSREELDEAAEELEHQYSDGREVPRPPHWNGYRLIPSVIEFWQVRRCHICGIPCGAQYQSEDAQTICERCRGAHPACMTAWHSIIRKKRHGPCDGYHRKTEVLCTC